MNIWTQALTRRHFTGLLLGSTLHGLLGIDPSWSKTDQLKETDQPSTVPLPKEPFIVFTEYQATVIEEVTALLIPTDQDPGAKEAGVVYALDRLAMRSSNAQKVLVQGVRWLDFMTQRISAKPSFLALDEQKRIQLLTFAETGALPGLPKIIPDVSSKLIEFGKNFFQFMLHHTMLVFYTSPSGWKVVRFPGPPQWEGNMDYHLC